MARHLHRILPERHTRSAIAGERRLVAAESLPPGRYHSGRHCAGKRAGRVDHSRRTHGVRHGPHEVHRLYSATALRSIQPRGSRRGPLSAVRSLQVSFVRPRDPACLSDVILSGVRRQPNTEKDLCKSFEKACPCFRVLCEGRGSHSGSYLTNAISMVILRRSRLLSPQSLFLKWCLHCSVVIVVAFVQHRIHENQALTFEKFAIMRRA